jgi:hypothetical protein
MLTGEGGPWQEGPSTGLKQQPVCSSSSSSSRGALQTVALAAEVAPGKKVHPQEKEEEKEEE